MSVCSPFGGVPHLADEGCTPSQVSVRVSHPADGLYPIPDPGRGGYPIQLMGGTPSQDQAGGISQPADRGYHIPGPGKGTPSMIGWGTPCPRLDGVHPPPPIRRLISKANTCYEAGGVPLAFTQEDFLVQLCSCEMNFYSQPMLIYLLRQ